MWIKKTEEQIKKEKKKIPIKVILFLSIILFVILSVGLKIGLPTRTHPDPQPLSWQELFERLPFIFIFSVFFSTIIMIGGKFVKGGGKKTFICNKCDHSKTDDGNYDCQCGGQYIDVSKYKWIDNDKY